MSIEVIDLIRASPKARVAFMFVLTDRLVFDLERNTKEQKAACGEHIEIMRDLINAEELDFEDRVSALEQLEEMLMRIDNC